jgi:hypothetical protein
MHTSVFYSLAFAALTSAAAVKTTVDTAEIMNKRQTQSACPGGYNYNGWFQWGEEGSDNWYAPSCNSHVGNPHMYAQPSCPTGHTGYCARSPVQFRPYSKFPGSHDAKPDGILTSLRQPG